MGRAPTQKLAEGEMNLTSRFAFLCTDFVNQKTVRCLQGAWVAIKALWMLSWIQYNLFINSHCTSLVITVVLCVLSGLWKGTHEP